MENRSRIIVDEPTDTVPKINPLCDRKKGEITGVPKVVTPKDATENVNQTVKLEQPVFKGPISSRNIKSGPDPQSTVEDFGSQIDTQMDVQMDAQTSVAKHQTLHSDMSKLPFKSSLSLYQRPCDICDYTLGNTMYSLCYFCDNVAHYACFSAQNSVDCFVVVPGDNGERYHYKCKHCRKCR